MSLLEVENLQVEFQTRKGSVRAVNGVSFCLEKGKTLALVGESGSGKSVSAMSILRLLDENGGIVGGEIRFAASSESEPRCKNARDKQHTQTNDYNSSHTHHP